MSTTFEHVTTTTSFTRQRDEVGRVETRGIDQIPDAERHGRPVALFGIWAAASVVYLNIVLGGLLILLGLGLWESLAICFVGNLWWAVVGWIAVSGPAAGAPTVVIMRAMFGIRGNALFGSGLGVAIGLFYIVLNLTFATLATDALLDLAGIAVPGGLDVIVLIAVAVAGTAISIFGHATIEKVSPYISIIVGVVFVVVGGFIVAATDWSYEPAALAPGEHIAMLLLGLTVIASTPLSWGTSADYSRYLPRATPKRRIVLWTALGGFIPSAIMCAMGVLAGTAVDMTDPQTSLAAVLPTWLFPLFLVAVIVGTLANNVLCAYSTGLYAQAFGARVHRSVWVALVGIAATLLSAYLLYAAESLLETMNYAIEIAVAVMGPLVAVYAVDIWLRRGSYDGAALNDATPASPFWYRGGWFVPGAVAMLVASTVAVLMVNTTLYVGPIALALGGADLSSIAGPVIAAALYAVLWRTTRPYRTPAARPALTWGHDGSEEAR
ncbi:Permease for cytosine/purine, uracil, thiamine, allantoin [Microbacterium terrae]|uniref:Permease for cytosine/purine, uracil, thiamine, allantoin n=1 Tax=Microbacterium terrae TaxID=69369 RepID=A0A0M2H4L1_9MICO|nr:Permease for cytosine/purine, uracil, thiamine, allantoin [Microbacterium terrae]